MKGFHFTVLILILLISLAYWYKQNIYVCPAPVHYSIGQVDDSFGVTRDQVIDYMSQAEASWEDELNRNLFEYDQSAKFTINFVFDDRQGLANQEEEDKDFLDDQRKETERVRATVERLQTDYENLSSSYAAQVKDYETQLQQYNAKVNSYNDQGGAPPAVFEELENERQLLNEKSQELNETADELNDLAQNINQYADQSNILVNQYNDEVEDYNTSYGFEREFTQGDYQGDKINVYKFSSDEELVSVLSHELGHALGIGHVESDQAVMYYLMEDVNNFPYLDRADLDAYYDVCGYEESFGQKVRSVIRGLI